MAFGLGALRLSPAQFWTLSLVETIAAWRGCHGTPAPPLSRTALETMMTEFPDRVNNPHE